MQLQEAFDPQIAETRLEAMDEDTYADLSARLIALAESSPLPDEQELRNLVIGLMTHAFLAGCHATAADQAADGPFPPSPELASAIDPPEADERRRTRMLPNGDVLVRFSPAQLAGFVEILMEGDEA